LNRGFRQYILAKSQVDSFETDASKSSRDTTLRIVFKGSRAYHFGDFMAEFQGMLQRRHKEVLDTLASSCIYGRLKTPRNTRASTPGTESSQAGTRKDRRARTSNSCRLWLTSRGRPVRDRPPCFPSSLGLVTSQGPMTAPGHPESPP
jgi:hypothetical protein